MRFATSTAVHWNDNKPSTHRRACVATCGFLLITVAAAMPVAADSGPTQSLVEVARRAEAAIREALPKPVPGVTAGEPRHRIAARPPDPRLRLPACPGVLEATVPVSAGGLRARTTVQVICPAPTTRWTVLVPVSLETEAEVLIAARPLARGLTPGPTDVQATRRTLPGISSLYISNLTEIRTQHLVRPVEAGQPLTRDALAADPVVRRGEDVTLVANLSGLEVRVPGRALGDARPGERVRVQNVSSLKVIEGRADDTGRVRVDR